MSINAGPSASVDVALTNGSAESSPVPSIRKQTLKAAPSSDAKSLSGSLNLDLECYWEEAQRIRQESPGIDDKQAPEEEDTKPEGETDVEGDATPGPARKEIRGGTMAPLTLTEAVSVVKSVALLSAMIRKRRMVLARTSIEESASADSDVLSPLRVSCDCSQHYQDQADPHPGDPRDADYLVLQSGDDNHTDDSAPLPEYRLRFQPTGVTYMDDLSSPDRDKIRHIAFMELTSIFNRYNLPLRASRPPKRKATTSESRVLGVPLTTLLERDQDRVPAAKCPVFMQDICRFLEHNALRDEGILRIPGNSARLKRLREELENGYDTGTFSWDGRRTNDAATLLKQFLRELPIPLLTHEYLRAFAIVEAITNRRDQVGALNLLVLLLPDVHRETLMVLLNQLRRITEFEHINKMGLSNVAMIIAPNLFCQLSKISRNADSEVKLAAGTSMVVRLMIFYCHVLFVVPNILITHLRDLNEAETSQARKTKNYKDVKKVLTSKKNSTAASRSELPSPVVGKVSKSNHYVIKVLSPEFPRISMILEINNHSRVCEVLTNFRRKQLGLISPTATSQASSDDNSSINALDLSVTKPTQKQMMSTIGENVLSPPSAKSIDIDRLCIKATSSSSLHDSLTSRRHSSPINHTTCNSKATNEDMYECEGNIGSRRLREGALVMEILKENPSTRFFVRKRNPDKSLGAAPIGVM